MHKYNRYACPVPIQMFQSTILQKLRKQSTQTDKRKLHTVT